MCSFILVGTDHNQTPNYCGCLLALRTLRPQDTSAPIFGAEVSRTLRHRCRSVWRHTSAPVPKCLKTLREGAAGQQQANRT